MKKILIVEDTVEVLENLSELLAMEHYLVFEASNGQEGIDQLYAKPPDLIITDLRMQRMDGFAFIETVRKVEAFAHIPIIVFSANTTPENERQCLHKGASRFIKKPCSTEVLLSIIHDTLIQQR